MLQISLQQLSYLSSSKQNKVYMNFIHISMEHSKKGQVKENEKCAKEEQNIKRQLEFQGNQETYWKFINLERNQKFASSTLQQNAHNQLMFFYLGDQAPPKEPIPAQPINELALLQKQIQANPKDHLLLNKLGDLYFKQRCYSDAVKTYKLSLALNDQQYSTICSMIESTIRLDQKCDSCLQFLNQAIAINQDQDIAYALCALYYLQSEEPDRAIAYANLSLKLNRNQHLAYYVKSHVFSARDKFKVSQQILQRALQLNQSDPLPLILHGRILLHKGDYHGAKVEFIGATQLDDKIHDAHFGIGQVYLAQHSYYMAQMNIEKALQLSPYNQKYVDVLARLILETQQSQAIRINLESKFQEKLHQLGFLQCHYYHAMFYMLCHSISCYTSLKDPSTSGQYEKIEAMIRNSAQIRPLVTTERDLYVDFFTEFEKIFNQTAQQIATRFLLWIKHTYQSFEKLLYFELKLAQMVYKLAEKRKTLETGCTTEEEFRELSTLQLVQKLKMSTILRSELMGFVDALKILRFMLDLQLQVQQYEGHYMFDIMKAVVLKE